MTDNELKEHATNDKASEDVIRAYEAKEKLSFTDDYREFLVRYNGIKFPGPPFVYSFHDGNGSLIQELATYDEVYSYATPMETEDGEDDEDGDDEDDDEGTYVYKFDHCVIGTNLSGDELILITEPGPNCGAVYGWEHESDAILLEYPEDDVRERLDELKTGDEQIAFLREDHAIFHLADSFSAFIESIKKSS